VLLVGLPPLTQHALEPRLSELADVEAVPFPGAAFEAMAEAFHPDIVVVDVTYLDPWVVRPLIGQRFLRDRPLVIYLPAPSKTGWFDDLATGESGPLADVGVHDLVSLASGCTLRVVAEG
jgi:hypothetical protein